MGGGLLQSLHIPDKTSGAQSPSQPPADPVGACAPGGPARVCCGYFRLAEWGSQQAHTRKGQFLPSHLGGTLGDWPPIQDCGSPAPSTAVSAQWAPWTEEALEWPPCCEETLAAHGEAPVEPTKRPPTLRSDDFPVNSPANAPAMGVRHLGSSSGGQKSKSGVAVSGGPEEEKLLHPSPGLRSWVFLGLWQHHSGLCLHFPQPFSASASSPLLIRTPAI
ncbi:uncharacterized protein LOC121104444 isoform X5 [Ursus maritimus]|uniref:Uncharacterized protein LOC121104444 isoform X5 n=1 Tax=Ursus maritimus TaxID=29073 RepID=A0A8M1GFA9_URSMA|nr:uncharacterized protein LOC121104444 isoform X5 [Ursus maritimus]